MARRPILENAVMEVLWDCEEWLNPAEVRHRMPEGASRAYTTVMTALVRLWKKGRLERRREGRAFAYHAVAGRAQYAAVQMDEMLGIARDRADALSRFVDALSVEDRQRLRESLEAE